MSDWGEGPDYPGPTAWRAPQTMGKYASDILSIGAHQYGVYIRKRYYIFVYVMCNTKKKKYNNHTEECVRVLKCSKTGTYYAGLPGLLRRYTTFMVPSVVSPNGSGSVALNVR